MAESPEDDILELLGALVRIPSVNPDLAPGEGNGEAEIARFAADWLAERNVGTHLDEAAPGRPNVVASVGPHDGRTLVVCAHLDTVSARGMSIPPFEPVVRDGQLYGRGSYDMKGSVAAAMAAAARLAGETIGGRLMLALVADEEYRSAGAVDFVRNHRADACIVTEPSDLNIVLAHKGFAWFEIETEGRAAHGSRWDVGDSAVARMAPVITALDAFDRQELRSRDHDLTGPASLHCAMIEGGTGWSTYADRCVLRVERRTVPGEAVDSVEAEIRDLVNGIDPKARTRTVFERPPFTCPSDEPIAEILRAASASVTGRTSEDTGVAYWMDAAIFAQAGIPTVNIGPSGGGAHAAEEWVDIASVQALADILAETARRFLARQTA